MNTRSIVTTVIVVAVLLFGVSQWSSNRDLSADNESLLADVDTLEEQLAGLQMTLAVPLPTYTPYPTYTAPPTSIPPTLTPIPPTSTPTHVPIPTIEIEKLVVEVTHTKVVFREICNNINGFLFNNNGWPIMFDCVYTSDGTVQGRIKYMQGNQFEVLVIADAEFNRIYKTEGDLTRQVQTFGTKIKSDGNQWYYMTVDGFFVPAWQVQKVN